MCFQDKYIIKELYDANIFFNQFFVCSIFFRNGKLSDHHKGDLTRIVRSNPINAEGSGLEQNGHAFLYDVELVLGGKLNGLPRSELQYTTASEEGMTGDSRRRRKRKPTLLQDDNNNNKNKGTTQTNKKKKTPANTKSTAKTPSSKTTTSKNANNKKRGSTKTATSTGKKKSKNSVSTAASASEAKVMIIDTKNPGNGKGMFERHKKEFERCLLRLQKLDMYNFFSDDDVPQEYDECYTSCSTATADENTAATTEHTALDVSIALQKSTNSSTSSDTPISSSSENENDDIKKETDSIAFPKHPPYNFIVLRKRLEHDRYVLDRLRLVENEENVDSNGKRITANDGKRRRSPSFSIQHPIGIHWALFRDDIIGMCNQAVERNSGNFDDGTPGTLSNTAEKIKVAMEQIYEKTGSRQSKEMELSNDAHRFTKVIEAVENQEAALQGKSWRRKGESTFYNRI